MMIRHNKPKISPRDKKAVLEVIDSGFLSAGRQVECFENAITKYLEAPGWSAALSNGTSALFLALYALGIKPKDKVILPTYACSALLNAVYMVKAVPVVVDINPDDFNISVQEVKRVLTVKPAAIIVPHIYGAPADLSKLKALGLPIIEDCAQAIGAEYKNRKAGTFGDISVFSFYATKLLTTGYGGMVYSRKREYIDKIKDYLAFDCRKDYYPRFNFQMGDIQAALGLSQLGKLDHFLRRRESIAKKYIAAFEGRVMGLQKMIASGKRVYYRFVIKVNKPRKLISMLKSSGIQAIVPVERWELLHRYLKLPRKDFPVAEEIAGSTVSLPIYPALKDQEVEHIIKVVTRGLRDAG